MSSEDFSPSLRSLVAEYDRQILTREIEIEKFRALREAAAMLLDSMVKVKDEAS